MPIPSNLVLDLDDTILDYSAPAVAVWARLYREYSQIMDIPVERLKKTVDENRRWYWSDPQRFREGRLDLIRARRIFIRMAFEKLGRSDFKTANAMADAFSRDRETVVQPFAGAIEALEMFRKNASRMVLLTNGESSMQRAKIERFDLRQFFHAILIEGETGIGKPDPLAFRAALATLNAAPQETWMIGDDLDFDIKPAEALGMHAAWICEEAKVCGRAAEFTVPSLSMLADHWEAEGKVTN
jgi:putative hydrolase of the HAD superfamily